LPPIGDQEYVYGATPPLGVTVAVPLDAPQEADVVDVKSVMAGGSVITNKVVSAQLLPSVTTTE
jgi:hypothetical protein